MVKKQITSPIKAIREKCLDCSCWSSNEVKLCAHEKCVLYPFRFGKNPFHKVSDKQRQEARIRLKAYHYKGKEQTIPIEGSLTPTKQES